MKHILLIPVGGTICTGLTEHGTLAVMSGAGARLKRDFETSDSLFAAECEIVLGENLFILSENMTAAMWNRMLEAYERYTAEASYDGVIFAHGSDTLAYSASLFAQLLCGCDKPIFFVAANERLDSPRSNGTANFRCAVECICRGIAPNVYVPYRNLSDGVMYLHLGSRLKQCANDSEDFFSAGSIVFEDMSEAAYRRALAKVEERWPSERRRPFFRGRKDCRLTARVLMLTPYVGMDYDAYDFSRFDAVLHGTYHSGTACAMKSEGSPSYGNHSILHMIDRCAGEGMPDLYLSPSEKSGEVYDTVRIIAEHEAAGKRIRFLNGWTNETAYAKLVLAYSLCNSEEERRAFLECECNFERIGLTDRV